MHYQRSRALYRYRWWSHPLDGGMAGNMSSGWKHIKWLKITVCNLKDISG